MLVPSIAANFGSPSYRTSRFAVDRLTAAVSGICASRSASSASSVPATLASTSPTGESGGIFEKLEGSESGGTKVQPPSEREVFLNQRPASRTCLLYTS